MILVLQFRQVTQKQRVLEKSIDTQSLCLNGQLRRRCLPGNMQTETSFRPRSFPLGKFHTVRLDLSAKLDRGKGVLQQVEWNHGVVIPVGIRIGGHTCVTDACGSGSLRRVFLEATLCLPVFSRPADPAGMLTPCPPPR